MLSPAELGALGYVDSLEQSFKASEDLTTVLTTSEINAGIVDDATKLHELEELVKEFNEINDLKGVLSMQMGIDVDHGHVINSTVYESPTALDSVFIVLFERFIRFASYTTVASVICFTSAEEVEECSNALTRFAVPPKFVVVPSLTSQARHEQGTTSNNNITDSAIERKAYDSSSIIRNLGSWKVKPEVTEDDTRWAALEQAMYEYNTAVLAMDDVFFVENALSREEGEFYFSEHYGNKAAVLTRAKYVQQQSDKFSAAMSPDVMYVFCSQDNVDFGKQILQKYNPKTWHVMEYTGKY